MKLFKYHETATCILVIFVLVFVSDWVCARPAQRSCEGRRFVVWRRCSRVAPAAKKSRSNIAQGKALIAEEKYEAAAAELVEGHRARQELDGGLAATSAMPTAG